MIDINFIILSLGLHRSLCDKIFPVFDKFQKRGSTFCRYNIQAWPPYESLFTLNNSIRSMADHIVSCKGIAWLIIMGSGFYDWIFWHFFTITVDYNSAHTELLLNVCLTNLSLLSESRTLNPEFESNRVESYVTTDGQSASLSWNKAPIWGLRPHFYYCQTVAGLLMWGALSDERAGLSFTIAAGPRQGSHSRVRVPLNSW
jgi:hypothetical protein